MHASLAVSVLAAAASAAQPAEPDWAAHAAGRLPLLEPCELPGIEETLLCGTLDVPEDRALPEGRRVSLKIVVVPAQSETPPSDPVFIFAGGPGGSATARAGSAVYTGAVRSRDIVLVDQRGTGGSGLIQCRLGGGEGATPGELKEMLPEADVAECAEALAARADVRQYDSASHAADIEAVRRHLGYGPINIQGGSYGTRAMMVYAQLYPGSTRTLFGIGVDSPERSNLAERGVLAAATLERLARLCAADDTCAAIAPRLDETLIGLLGSLDEGPRRIEVEGARLDVGRAWLAENLRLLLYYVFTSRALPWAIHQAAQGDWQPLVRMARGIERMFKSTLSYGVLLTVQCSEHMDFDVEAALARGAATPFGNYRLEQQLQGCRAWPHERKPALGVDEPRVLDVPTLFLSGRLDPVTPPEYADEAARLFPNNRHIVLEEGHHGPFDLENGWECVHEIWADFLEKGAVDALETGCAASMTRAPFVVGQSAFDAHLQKIFPAEDS